MELIWNFRRLSLAQLPMNQQQKVHQLYNTHFREINVPKHFIVFIIGHNVTCVGLYGAVNELVVIRVSGDKVETECGINKFNMPALHEGADDSLCKFWSEEPFQDFLVFKSISLETHNVFCPFNTDNQTSR